MEKSCVSVSESDTCVFCGSFSRNHRYNEDAICRYVDKQKSLLQRGPKSVRKTKSWYEKASNKLYFVTCSICKSKSCIECVKSLCCKLEEDKCHSSNNWYQTTQQVLINNVIPASFIGHCCEVQCRIKKATEQSTSNITVQENDGSKRVFKAGLLHLPELYLLLDSPMVHYVDVHGLGREKSNGEEKPGILHAVLHEDIIVDNLAETKSILLERKQLVPTICNAIG